MSNETTSLSENRRPGEVFSSSGPTAPSQGGVKQNVGCGGLDRGGGDVRHLMVVKLVPALFKDTLTVGCVMATIQTPIVVLLKKKRKSSHQNVILCNAGISFMEGFLLF